MSDAIKSLKYQLKLNGSGLSFERSVEEPIALAVMQIVLNGSTDAVTPGQINQPPAHTDHRAMLDARSSPRAFIDSVQAQSLAAKIVAIAAYAREVEKKADFSQEEIRGRFKAAGEAAPTNVSRDFRTAVSNGWIAEDPQKPGRYFITTQGDVALTNKFAGAHASTGRRRRQKRATAKDAAIKDEH